MDKEGPGDFFNKANAQENNHKTFEDYLEQLDLLPEDLKKKILDIGSGSEASFAFGAKEKGLGNEIYSIDPRKGNLNSIKFVTGQAEFLPFKDKEFEIITSNAAFPFFVIKDKEINTQLLSGNTKPAENRIRQVLKEMLRVIGESGQIKLGRVTKNITIGPQRILEDIFEKVLKEFVLDKKISAEWIQKDPLMDNKDLTKKMADLYLVKINKLKNT